MIPKRVIEGAKEALMLATADADAMFNEDARQRRIYDGLNFLEQLLRAATEFNAARGSEHVR